MTDLLKDIVSLFFLLIQFTFFICILIFLILILSKINRRIFKHFYKKDIPRPAVVGHILNSRIRRVIQPPKSIIDALDVREGMNILEIGAGGGTFTLEAARRTRSGTVFATDVSDGMLTVLKSNVMKKLVFLIVVMFIGVNLFAQTGQLEVTITGVKFMKDSEKGVFIYGAPGVYTVKFPYRFVR